MAIELARIAYPFDRAECPRRPPRKRRPSRGGLALEQRALALHAPAIARQRAVVAHHAMAGNRHREPVGAAGLRHRAHRLRRADAPGERVWIVTHHDRAHAALALRDEDRPERAFAP